jgi:hypothetical protein
MRSIFTFFSENAEKRDRSADAENEQLRAEMDALKLENMRLRGEVDTKALELSKAAALQRSPQTMEKAVDQNIQSTNAITARIEEMERLLEYLREESERYGRLYHETFGFKVVRICFLALVRLSLTFFDDVDLTND